MNLRFSSYAEQARRWPQSGRHILAQFDDETIIVYQAYRPSIGRFAVEHGRFGGDFKYTRMSWIKPNFLWMMYRSDWGAAKGQEVVLALRLRRAFFESLLENAVASSFSSAHFEDDDEWQAALEQSEVRLQWDPDHLPNGKPCARRAIQLGLRGAALEAFGQHEIIEVIDISEFVAGQREKRYAWRNGELITPTEDVFEPVSRTAAEVVGLG
jgi:hypothetical protein